MGFVDYQFGDISPPQRSVTPSVHGVLDRSFPPSAFSKNTAMMQQQLVFSFPTPIIMYHSLTNCLQSSTPFHRPQDKLRSKIPRTLRHSDDQDDDDSPPRKRRIVRSAPRRSPEGEEEEEEDDRGLEGNLIQLDDDDEQLSVASPEPPATNIRKNRAATTSSRRQPTTTGIRTDLPPLLVYGPRTERYTADDIVRPPTDDAEKEYRCPRCPDRKFGRFKYVESHCARIHKRQTLLKCRVQGCEETFASLSLLSFHEKRDHEFSFK